MKRKFLSIVLIVLTMLSTLFTLKGCGNDSKNEANSSINTSENHNTINNTSNTKNEATTNNESEYFNLYGIDIAVPKSFKSENIYSKRVWSGKKSTDNMIYYDIDFLLDYGSVASIDSYSLENTPDIMCTYILDVIDEYYPVTKSKSTNTVNTEEIRNMLGYDVIRRTGVIHTDTYGETHELNYAAYYGLLDLQNGTYKKIPTVWIAFSESNDSQTKLDLQNIVDSAYNNAKFRK